VKGAGANLAIVSGDNTILVHPQEDQEQKVFDIRANLLKTVPGVTSRDKVLLLFRKKTMMAGLTMIYQYKSTKMY